MTTANTLSFTRAKKIRSSLLYTHPRIKNNVTIAHVTLDFNVKVNFNLNGRKNVPPTPLRDKWEGDEKAGCGNRLIVHIPSNRY